MLSKKVISKIDSVLLLVLFFSALTIPAFSQIKVVGFHKSWINIPAPDQIEFQNLTHIIQTFAWPNADGTIAMTSGIPDTALVRLAHTANKKVLVSFGGVDNSAGFAPMTADSSLRSKFITNVVNFLTAYNYDGIDLDWEYPTFRQSGSLTQLVIELREKFNTISPGMLIAIDAPATASSGQLYQYQNLIDYIDWFAIMSYDYYGSWSTRSGHNAPLYQSPIDNVGSVYNSVQYMSVTRNVPLNKLLVGIPFYGKEFNASGLYQPCSGSVPDLTYSDVINTVSSPGWTYCWDSVSSVPYYVNMPANKFITFDDTSSVRLKTEFAISQHLGGVMIWALGQDLLNSSQPLLESIAKTVKNNPVSVKTEPVQTANSFNLYENYPNPFNPSTTIKFSIEKTSMVKLIIYDVMGRELKTLINQTLNPGVHSVVFEGNGLSSGIYFFVLTSGSQSLSKKMILLK